MGETWTIEGFRAGLEELGVSEVRRRLAGSVFGPVRSEKYQLVEQWLFEKANERESEREAAAKAIALESNDIARAANALASDSNRIAERAASSARTANKIALTAAIIAAVAVIIAAWPYLPWSAPGASPAASYSPGLPLVRRQLGAKHPPYRLVELGFVAFGSVVHEARRRSLG